MVSPDQSKNPVVVRLQDDNATEPVEQMLVVFCSSIICIAFAWREGVIQIAVEDWPLCNEGLLDLDIDY